MKSILLATFTLSALVWAGAQQPNSMGSQGGAQAGAPGAPAGQSSSMPGSASQGPSSGAPGAAGPGATSSPQAGGSAQASGPVTEGCLGGSNPNFTITDTAGKTYKLTLPPNADGAKLTPHVGESVQVMGQVNQSGGSNAISVSQIGRGSGTCPGK